MLQALRLTSGTLHSHRQTTIFPGGQPAIPKESTLSNCPSPTPSTLHTRRSSQTTHTTHSITLTRYFRAQMQHRCNTDATQMQQFSTLTHPIPHGEKRKEQCPPACPTYRREPSTCSANTSDQQLGTTPSKSPHSDQISGLQKKKFKRSSEVVSESLSRVKGLTPSPKGPFPWIPTSRRVTQPSMGIEESRGGRNLETTPSQTFLHRLHDGRSMGLTKYEFESYSASTYGPPAVWGLVRLTALPSETSCDSDASLHDRHRTFNT